MDAGALTGILGLSGATALLTLDKAIALVKASRNGKPESKSADSPGSLPVAFWLSQFDQNRKATVDAINASMQPIAAGFERMEGAMTDIRDIAIFLKNEAQRRG